MSTIKERIYHETVDLPYLVCPVDGGHTGITEGTIYSKQERSIHKNFYHKGVDYERPYGSPVYAAAAGYAVGFYHRLPIIIQHFFALRLYQGLPISNGLGFGVQVFHPKKICGIKGGRITQYGHLSNISESIDVRLTKPILNNWEEILIAKNETLRSYRKSRVDLGELIRVTNDFTSKYPWLLKTYGTRLTENLETMESYFLTLSELESLNKAKSTSVHWVEQGEQIGTVGDSGLFWGGADYNEGKRPGKNGLPEKAIESKWDETHLHFEEAQRHPIHRTKHRHRDPYNIYKSYSHYREGNFVETLFTDI